MQAAETDASDSISGEWSHAASESRIIDRQKRREFVFRSESSSSRGREKFSEPTA